MQTAMCFQRPFLLRTLDALVTRCRHKLANVSNRKLLQCLTKQFTLSRPDVKAENIFQYQH